MTEPERLSLAEWLVLCLVREEPTYGLVLVGLLARGATPAQAACWATYLHSTAGERLASSIGQVGFLARELVDQVPAVLAEMS